MQISILIANIQTVFSKSEVRRERPRQIVVKNKEENGVSGKYHHHHVIYWISRTNSETIKCVRIQIYWTSGSTRYYSEKNSLLHA